MDPNNSCHSSSHSADTDVLIKIPNNFFDPNFNFDKTHFSNDGDFMTELDNFLHTENKKDVLNSTDNEQMSYKSFVDPLHGSEITNQDLNLQEEQLKRQHFEQLCGLLQKKIIQYQQKVSFIVKVDQEKDQLIRRLKHNEGLDIENNRLKFKISKLEQEVTETIHLINKFQTKNEMLELKIENLTSTSTEMREISKKQIHDLEIRLNNNTKTEIDLQHEIEELKANCKAEKENFVKEKHARSLLDREVCNLKSQVKQLREDKMRLQERNEKDKQTIALKQKKIFNSMMDEFAEKERSLLKELDMQRMALKNYYQSQLETALEEKVSEFQDQLESFQNEIKQEAVRRERHHNERTINQVEMIVRK
jgi:centrobin